MASAGWVGMEDIASWVAPIATTIAALMTASNLGNRITGIGFIVFTVGSLAWLMLGIATGQDNLLWQNIVLTLLNLFGVWRWLGRETKIEEGGKTAQARSVDTPGETLFPVSLLTRAPLVGAGGDKLGALVDAMAGCRSGRIAYLVATSGGIGGVGEQFHRLEWDDVRIKGDEVCADLDSDTFAAKPELGKDDWPGQ